MEKEEKICKNCGEQIKENDKFCRKCGAYIETEQDNENATGIVLGYGICISLAIVFELIYAVAESLYFFNFLSTLLFQGALILLITGKIKYKKNKKINILFWANIIIYTILFLYFSYKLVYCLNSCPECLPGY